MLILPNRRRIILPQGIPRNGLVGWWKFNDGSGQTLKDYSGKGNHGTLGADSGASTDDPTWTSQGLSFDGGDYVKGSTDIIPVTYLVAVKITANGSAADGLLCYCKETLQYYGNFIADTRAVSMKTMLQVGIGGGDYYRMSANASNIALDQVALFSATINPTTGLGDMYKNGTKIASTVYTTGSWISTGSNGKFSLGAISTGTSGFLTGSIYYALAYNRALTAFEHKQVYKIIKRELSARGVTLS